MPTQALKAGKKADSIGKRRRQLRTFLSQWVYKEIRKDYNIQQKGVHFFNILDLVYGNSVMTPVGFYNQCRMLVMANTAKNGDTIKLNGQTMTADEKLSPTF